MPRPRGRGDRQPLRRLLAWLIDWACILVWVGVVAAVGVPLHLAGVTGGLDPLALNALATATVVIPVTIALAAFESSRLRATPGKLALRVVVKRMPARSEVALPRALARNALKVALPWTIGHAAVFALASESGAPGPWAWVLLAAAYLLPLAYVVALFVGSGRTPYDRIVGTAVLRRDETTGKAAAG